MALPSGDQRGWLAPPADTASFTAGVAPSAATSHRLCTPLLASRSVDRWL